MVANVKIRNLILEGFRGARKEIELSFEDGNKSIVLFGNNGDGKSSFSDALEWFYTDKIEYLQREGCGREDYFNRFMPSENDAAVNINFDKNILDSQKALKRKGGYSFSNTNEDFKEYISKSSAESFILRHHTMRRFIDKTKKEKLEEVEEIIGFNIVKEIRDSLLKSLNALKDDIHLSILRGQAIERKMDLSSIIEKEEFVETDILNFADYLAKKCDVDLSVSNSVDFKSVIEKLDKKIKADYRGKELLKLDIINENLFILLKKKEVIQKIIDLIEHHNELSEHQETIKASALEKLYKAAIEAIENKLVEPGKCPLCKKPTDTALLLLSLAGEIKEFEKILEERKQIIQNTNLLYSDMKFQNNIQTLLKLDSEVKAEILGSDLNKKLSGVSQILMQCEEILSNIQKSPEYVPLPLFSKKLLNLDENVRNSQEKIIQRKKELSETEEEKKFYQNVHTLRKLYENHIRYVDINKQIGIFKEQINSLETIYHDFEKMERESVKKVLKAISSDVNDLFKFLHPDDNFDEIELIPTEGRGIEFKLKYHGQEISPPMKVLSEAHLNSLGICLFLSSVKHFNNINKFLVLDDVITSFDTEHRRPLARLLNEKFSDIQFLLFTHEELWFEMLKRDLSRERWLFKELMKWTKDNGIDVKDSPMTLKERIKKSLDTNDIQAATNKCRILIEEIFKEKCENLGVKGLEFRTGYKNEQREASDLINALVSYLRKNQSLRNKQSKIVFNHLRASQLITNIGSHHNALRTTALSRGDIEAVLRDIDEFESLFICSYCKTEPNKKLSPRDSDLKQCKCGKLWV